jgi:poly(A) polymerase Pap1
MSEKNNQFNTLEKYTKPKRFRKLRTLVRRLAELRYVIPYYWYLLLSKIHIYNKYIYTDKVSKAIRPPQFFEAIDRQVVSNNVFRADVDWWITLEHWYNIEYFYRYTKRGKKIVYTVKNEEKVVWLLESKLSNVCFHLEDNTWTLLKDSRLQTVQLVNPSMSLLDSHKQVSYETVTYDFSPIFNLRNKFALGVDLTLDILSIEEVRYYVEVSRKNLQKCVDNVSVFSMITNRVQHKLGGIVKDMTEN